MAFSLTLSANSGISLEIGGYKIMVDALHSEKVEQFSVVSPRLLRMMERSEAFSSPDVICCTHCHADHYSRELVAHYKKHFPKSTVITPGRDFPDQIRIRGKKQVIETDDLKLEFFELPHEPVPYELVPHYGIIVSCEGESVLFTGDCRIADPALFEYLGERHLSAAQLDFPWITGKFGRECLKEYDIADHLVFTHIPFAEDDIYAYRTAVQRSLGKLAGRDITVLQDPLQQIFFDR